MAKSGWTIGQMQNLGSSLGGVFEAIGNRRRRAEYEADRERQRQREAEEDKRRQEEGDLKMDTMRLSIPGATGEDVARNAQRRPDNPLRLEQSQQLPGGGSQQRWIPANKLRQFGNVLDTEEQVRQRIMGPQPEYYRPEVVEQMQRGQAEKDALRARQQFESSLGGQKLQAREREFAAKSEQSQAVNQQRAVMNLLRSVGAQLQNMRYANPSYEDSPEYQNLFKLFQTLSSLIVEPSPEDKHRMLEEESQMSLPRN